MDIRRMIRARASRPLLAVLLILAAGCAERTDGEPETVLQVEPPTWFEDAFSSFEVAPGGDWAVWNGAAGPRLFDIASGRPDSDRLHHNTGDVFWAGFAPGTDALLRLAEGPDGPGWFLQVEGELRPLEAPAGTWPVLTPDGERIAWFAPSDPFIRIATAGAVDSVALEGSPRALAWAPDGETLYVLSRQPTGRSALLRIDADRLVSAVVRDGLDAPATSNSIAIAPSGRVAFLALASDTVPDDVERHNPLADRDTDLYAINLGNGSLRLAVASPVDDFHPVVAGRYLYWTRNVMRDDIVMVPVEGGDATVVLEYAQLPYWHPGGRRIAVTQGPWRLADWALDLDAFRVNLDDSNRVISTPRPLAAGWHEDFTPTWSPDSQWLAYHSHRSPGPVPAYDSPGSTDDIWLRRVDAPPEAEIRLTDFGHEVGPPDWAPDGRRLVFDSWDADQPGAGKPWIVTIDPATGELRSAERVPLPPEVAGTMQLAWSPDGRSLAFIGATPGRPHSLWTIRPDGSGARRLAEFDVTTYGGVDWTPDGRAIVYGALGTNGRMQLFRIAAEGGEPVALTDDPSGIILPQVSPDGRTIAAMRIERTQELRRVHLR